MIPVKSVEPLASKNPYGKNICSNPQRSKNKYQDSLHQVLHSQATHHAWQKLTSEIRKVLRAHYK
jgi:hypothetical protein